MSLLQYTSDEMFSATDLVRKNKSIFDKLQKKEIEKAIILRDGKPSIMMLDFSEYEKLMKDYLNLKAGNSTNINTKTINEKVVEEKTIKSSKKNKKRYKSHCINSWKKQIKHFINVIDLDGYLENH